MKVVSRWQIAVLCVVVASCAQRDEGADVPRATVKAAPVPTIAPSTEPKPTTLTTTPPPTTVSKRAEDEAAIRYVIEKGIKTYHTQMVTGFPDVMQLRPFYTNNIFDQYVQEFPAAPTLPTYFKAGLIDQVVVDQIVFSEFRSATAVACVRNDIATWSKNETAVIEDDFKVKGSIGIFARKITILKEGEEWLIDGTESIKYATCSSVF
jgi:hypothetical protein